MKFLWLAAVPVSLWTASTLLAQTKATKTSANAVKYADLVNGGKLPYGGNVTLTGQLQDLKCGSNAISDVITITAISVSYLGQTAQPAAPSIKGGNWTAPLGTLPADTAINLQLKITGTISDAKKAEVVDDLLADPLFLSNIRYLDTESKDKDAKVVDMLAQQLLTNISAPAGSLTKILGTLLPSCIVATDVTAAAIAGLRNTALVPLFAAPTRLKDLKTSLGEDMKLDGFNPSMSPKDIRKFIDTVRDSVTKGTYTKQGGKPLSLMTAQPSWTSLNTSQTRTIRCLRLLPAM